MFVHQVTSAAIHELSCKWTRKRLAGGLGLDHDRISGREQVIDRSSPIQEKLERAGEASLQEQPLSHRFFGASRAG
jgi:hypothetical protein